MVDWSDWLFIEIILMTYNIVEKMKNKIIKKEKKEKENIV